MILRKIIENAATRCHIVKLKCTKFDFGWGSAQNLGGELTALPRPLAGFTGPISKGRKDGKEGQGGGMGRKSREKREGNGGKENMSEGRVALWLLVGWTPLFAVSMEPHPHYDF